MQQEVSAEADFVTHASSLMMHQSALSIHMVSLLPADILRYLSAVGLTCMQPGSSKVSSNMYLPNMAILGTWAGLASQALQYNSISRIVPWAAWLQPVLLQLQWTMTHSSTLSAADAGKLLMVQATASTLLKTAAVPAAHPGLNSCGLASTAAAKGGAKVDLVVHVLQQRVSSGAGAL